MKNLVLTLMLILVLAFGTAQGQITSAQSGPFEDPNTWVGGVVPTSADDILITSGHTVSVNDNSPECNSVSFADNTANFDMNAGGMLTVYGDFTLAATDHNAFAGGWSSGSNGIKFAGNGTQTLSGWNTGGGSTSFRDAIIDKPVGEKVITAGNGMRLCFQNSLEIISGVLEFGEDDDLEARWASSGNLTNDQNLQITIQVDGAFLMLDGAGSHFIRSGTGSLPIGKMTIYGNVELYDGSSYDVSIAGIDIKDGGQLKLGTGLSSTTYGAMFNPGTIAVEAGGTLYSITTSDLWFDTTVVDLQDGGVFNIYSSSQVMPPVFLNNGKVRYMRNSSSSSLDQTVNDIDYYDLEFSYQSNPDHEKIWMLEGDHTIADSLTTNNSAVAILTAEEPHLLTVNGTIRMTSGLIDNGDPDVTLQLGDGALISRATGEMAIAPDFAGAVNLRYTSTTTSVTTGPEMPTDVNVLNDLTITSNDQIVTLGTDVTVNGILSIETGTLATDGYMLTLGEYGTVDESAGYYLLGNLYTERSALMATNNDFGGIGFEINAADAEPGMTSVLRVTGNAFDINGDPGILRSYNVIPANNSALDATIVIHYSDNDLNGL
ncbi:MAG: hypothetical protein ABIJ45_10205, partial [Candidatus Zixiibacteriota bacterium]